MSSQDYIPDDDQGLNTFAANFSTLISADPAGYGLLSSDATLYLSKQSTYAEALTAATDPSTRGGSKILAKDIARRDLVNFTRLLVRTIQGTPTVTDQQKYDLGITVRDVSPSPIGTPGFAPTVLVKSVQNTSVDIRLIDAANPTRRGRPTGVDGAAIFSATGAAPPPAGSAGWKFEGNASRMQVKVTFPADTAPGTRVWLAAYYFNPRKQPGPLSAAAGTNLPGADSVAV
jgi:hypothetical protein